jgi:hypothetical protein
VLNAKGTSNLFLRVEEEHVDGVDRAATPTGDLLARESHELPEADALLVPREQGEHFPQQNALLDLLGRPVERGDTRQRASLASEPSVR